MSKEMVFPDDVRRFQINEEIRERNKEFESLDAAGKRVQIAKDVLEMLQARKIIPNRGAYFYFLQHHSDEHYISNIQIKEMRLGLHELIADNQCRVCALGGLFTALVARVNGVPGATYVDDVYTKLMGFFEKNQLNLIEIVFEGWDDNIFLSPNGMTKLFKFKNMFPNSADRMSEIMKNIIENNGTFVF